MTIDWGALGVVAVVSLVVGVGVVVLVSLALIGLSAREPDPVAGSADDALVIGRGGSGLPRVVLGATAPHTVGRHQNVSAEVCRAGRGPVRRTGSVWGRCSWVGRVLPAARPTCWPPCCTRPGTRSPTAAG